MTNFFVDSFRLQKKMDQFAKLFARPPASKALSSVMMFLFKLAWIGQIPIPLSIAAVELLLNLRVQLNINIDFA